MEWDQFSYAPKINAVVHYDLINLKIDGSKKSPFQILGSNHCNFLPRFPIGPTFSAVLDPVTLYYCTTTQLHPSDGHKLYNFKEKRLPGFRKPVFCLLQLNNTIFFNRFSLIASTFYRLSATFRGDLLW